MRVCVLGAGVIGVTTAYFLAKDGHEVVVVDRAAGPALDTSHANGGQISVSHTDPWASPANLKKVWTWIGKPDAPIALRMSLDPALLRWLSLFVANCTEARHERNTERMLRVALYSQRMLHRVVADLTPDFDARRTGILHVYRDSDAYEQALEQAEAVTALGCPRVPISRDRAVEIEPALADAAANLAGVIHAPGDESGDARMFTEAVAAACEDMGVAMRFGTAVEGLRVEGGRVRGVLTRTGAVAADAVVAALGSYTPLLLKEWDISLPVYPAKGYSVTLDVGAGHTAPVTALIDDERKLVYSRLGSRLRVAGLAETVGYDTRIDDVRARLVLEGAMSLFPNPGDVSGARFWTGLRPQTPDSVPVLGPTPIRGLFLNTGHGTLGWTMACGSARIVADAVAGKSPAIEVSGLTVDRFL